MLRQDQQHPRGFETGRRCHINEAMNLRICDSGHEQILPASIELVEQAFAQDARSRTRPRSRSPRGERWIAAVAVGAPVARPSSWSPVPRGRSRLHPPGWPARRRSSDFGSSCRPDTRSGRRDGNDAAGGGRAPAVTPVRGGGGAARRPARRPREPAVARHQRSRAGGGGAPAPRVRLPRARAGGDDQAPRAPPLRRLPRLLLHRGVRRRADGRGVLDRGS